MTKYKAVLKDIDVHDLVIYDSTDGRAFWLFRDIKWFNGNSRICKSWNSKNAGKEIISQSPDGYIFLTILGRRIPLHRLIWFYQTGEWPEVIDHINGNRLDNRWCNLRNVTNQENRRNMKKPKNNTSGVIGVCLERRTNKWLAQIRNNNGQNINLGLFNTKEEAIRVRKAAEIEYGYHENHGRD